MALIPLKFSELSSAATPWSGSEKVPIVQDQGTGANNYVASIAQLQTLEASAFSSLPAANSAGAGALKYVPDSPLGKATMVSDGAQWKYVEAESFSQLVFTPGGDGQVSVWRFDAARPQGPRTASVASVSGDVLTLQTNDAPLFFTNSMMSNVSYVRIWNTSKTAPGAPAWVKSSPADDQLQVTSSADISTWANGDVVQIGDPTPTPTPTRAIALDISPMLQSVLGTVFQQKGIMAKAVASGNGEVGIALSGSAVAGAFVEAYSRSDGNTSGSVVITSTTTLSPISNSNLVFVREDAISPTELSTALVSIIGVYA